jgi:uridine kinase
MSFKPEFDLVYHAGIKKAVEDQGLVCVRLDDDALPKNIPARIVREIIESDLIIADLTEPNPNVYYELGISHAIGNKTIVISQNLENLPFDVRNESTLGYTSTKEGIKLLYYELQRIIKRLLAHPDQPSNIVQIAGRDYFDLQGKIRITLKDLIEEKQRVQAFQQYLSNQRNTDNKEVIETLGTHLLEISKGATKPIFIGVSGGAGLGKTRLSVELLSWFHQHTPQVGAGVLPLDSFMMNRVERLLKNLSGYDPRANDLEAAFGAIQSLRSGKAVKFFPFNHTTGEHEKDEHKLEPVDIVILDGIHALQPRILPLLSFKVFLYAQPPVAKELRFLADIFERNYTAHKAFEHSDEEFSNFEEFVLQYVKFADRVVEVDGYWKYKL